MGSDNGYTGPFPNPFAQDVRTGKLYSDGTFAYDPEPPGLSERDVARIADAVAERLRPSPLAVSGAELRRYLARPR